MTKRFNPPSAQRLSAVAIAAAVAAFAGTASGQSGYLTNSGGQTVYSGFGECVRVGTGAPAAACPPMTRTSASAAAPAATASSRAASAQPAAAGGTAMKLPGYAVASDGRVVLNGSRECVRAGHWTAANAAGPAPVSRQQLGRPARGGVDPGGL